MTLSHLLHQPAGCAAVGRTAAGGQPAGAADGIMSYVYVYMLYVLYLSMYIYIYIYIVRFVNNSQHSQNK